MRYIIHFICIVIALAVVCSSSVADIVTLKDGTVIEGVIIKETGAEVVIETTISNIKTTQTFPRYKVKSIEHTPIESSEAESNTESATSTSSENASSDQDDLDEDESETPSSSRRTRTTRDAGPRTPYIVIPVDGVIGEGTNVHGLRNALTQASRKKISHVVFTIDSPGGYVYDAVEVLKVLKEFDDEMVYHALIEEGAISAASVYVAAADDIFVRPDARLGGAVAYSNDSSTGSAEVDAKFNSIWAAEVASRAASKGYPAEVFRAMAVLEAEVWMDDEGKITASRPSKGAEQLDSRTTILTILASQMVKAGMAKEFTGALDELGETLGLEGWTEAKNLGQRVMSTAGKERIALSEKRTKALDIYRKAYAELETNLPTEFSDYRFYRTANNERFPDPDSVRLWTARSDICIQACTTMLQSLVQIADVNKKAERIEALHLYTPNDIGHDAYIEIQTARNELSANRLNIPLSRYGG